MYASQLSLVGFNKSRPPTGQRRRDAASAFHRRRVCPYSAFMSSASSTSLSFLLLFQVIRHGLSAAARPIRAKMRVSGPAAPTICCDDVSNKTAADHSLRSVAMEDDNRTLASSMVEILKPVPYDRLLETHVVAEDHATFVVGMLLLIGIAVCFCAVLTRLTKPPTLYRTICYSRISRNEIVAWIRLDEAPNRRCTLPKWPSFVVFLRSVVHSVRPTLLSTSLSASLRPDESQAASSRMLMHRWSVGSLPSYDVATTCLTASPSLRAETPPPRYEDVTAPFVDRTELSADVVA